MGAYSDDEYTDENGNYSLLTADERAELRDDSEVIYTRRRRDGCMVFLAGGVGLAAALFEFVRWLA